jgi:hypothetical protein
MQQRRRDALWRLHRLDIRLDIENKEGSKDARSLTLKVTVLLTGPLVLLLYQLLITARSVGRRKRSSRGGLRFKRIGTAAKAATKGRSWALSSWSYGGEASHMVTTLAEPTTNTTTLRRLRR